MFTLCFFIFTVFRLSLRSLSSSYHHQYSTAMRPSLVILHCSSLVLRRLPLSHVLCLMSYVSTQAHVEYLKKNYRKSIHFLGSCHAYSKDPFMPTAASLPTAPETVGYLNNMGCIFLKMEKLHVSNLYFQRALHYASSALANSNSTLTATENKSGVCGSTSGAQTLSSPLKHRHSQEVVYNNGLSHLLSKRPLEAFLCFESTSRLYYDRPLVWLRMAECCIMYDIQVKEEAVKGKPRLYVTTVGAGRSRRILLR